MIVKCLQCGFYFKDKDLIIIVGVNQRVYCDDCVDQLYPEFKNKTSNN